MSLPDIETVHRLSSSLSNLDDRSRVFAKLRPVARTFKEIGSPVHSQTKENVLRHERRTSHRLHNVRARHSPSTLCGRCYRSLINARVKLRYFGNRKTLRAQISYFVDLTMRLNRKLLQLWHAVCGNARFISGWRDKIIAQDCAQKSPTKNQTVMSIAQ